VTEFVQFALLGLGSGAIYVLAGQGVVQIYRGSGVLNFAHGAMALLAATLFVRLWSDWGWELGPAIAITIAVSAALGVATHLLVMRPLRAASPLVRIVATIGVLAILQQGVLLVFGSQLTFESFVSSYYPAGAWTLSDGVTVGYDRLVLTAVAIGVTALLAIAMRFATFGLSTQAVAESRLATRAVGRSPDRIALLNWALGATLAGAAGVLIVPISGLANVAILLLVVPALAAALVGGFRSYWLTAIGGLALGMGQSLLTNYTTQYDLPAGLADALPFLVIIAVLTVRGSAIPRRDERPALLPRVARRPPNPGVVVPATVGGVALAALASNHLANTLATTFLVALVAVSLVVVTGLSGQISLAQFALAGIGGFAAGRLSDLFGWPFIVLLPIGVAAAVLVGFVFAIPALRTRGPALAVATIGLGLAVEKIVFNDSDLIGGLTTTPVERPTLFGWEISSVTHPQRYAAVTVVAFAVVAVAVANLRSGRIGRRLLAVRSNERAAAALGISVGGAKLYAFGLGAGIAAVGGVLMAFRFDSVQYSQYGFFASLELVTVSLIGGIGYLAGTLIGALQVPGGIVSYLAEGVSNLERWLVLGSGALLIVTLILFPDGIASYVDRFLTRLRVSAPDEMRSPKPSAGPAERISAAPLPRVAPRELQVRDLVVTFRAARAVDGVSLAVEPGRITGLIGANGAGKTTLIDAVTGFVRPASGAVLLGGADLTRRSPRVRARAGIGRCFQTVELFGDMSVREHLLVAAEPIRLAAWVGALVRPGRDELAPEIAALATALGLDDDLDRQPHELPHGRRRLVGVARALAARPSVLLLDEPAAGLDAVETRELGDLLRRVARDQGVGILVVEHDVGLVLDVSDTVVAIDFGRTIYSGPPTGVLGDEVVRAAYLGSHDPSAADPAVAAGTTAGIA
jgi:branched-subunit amino acid ABC-type transport system permease component/ABC-type branched-subunit amino acid transport system ATPase component